MSLDSPSALNVWRLVLGEDGLGALETVGLQAGD